MIDPIQKTEVACPLNGKLCVDGSREDFPRNSIGGLVKCRWWQHLAGKDPQSEKMVDQYDCAIAWMPVVTIEGAQMSRQTAASVDKVSNGVDEVRGALGTVARALQIASTNIRQGIEAGSLHLLVQPKADNGDKPDA